MQGDCYAFRGNLFVFGDLNDTWTAEGLVVPAIHRYIQTRTIWTDLDPLLLDIVPVVVRNGQFVPPNYVVPTAAPRGTAHICR